jgi:uncharacterized protein (DUF1015 family)
VLSPFIIFKSNENYFNLIYLRMKILPFKASYPDLDKVPHTDAFFETVKFQYQEYADEGMFDAATQEALYIYRITDKDGKKKTGLVTCTHINDYLDGHIKKHEKTIVKNEAIQSELLLKRSAAIKPVLLIYPSVKEVNELINKSLDSNKKLYVITIGDEKHCFWQITDPATITQFQELFETEVPTAYIADGHHRSATFAEQHKKSPTEKTSKMLCAYFPEEEVVIKEFSRIVSDLNGMSSDVFLMKLTQLFKIKILKRGEKPYTKFEYTMYLEGKWFAMYWRKSELKDFAKGLVILDVHLLNEKILKPMFGVKNIRTDARVTYVEGDKTIDYIEKICPAEGVAFCLYPVEMEDLIEVSDSNGTMPPKSTYFEPRMKNGLLVYEI